MSRAIRRTNRSVFALVAAMTAATAASTTASAFEPIRKPEQREAARLRKAAHPGSAPVDCTHYPGGAPSAVNCSMQYNNGPVISNVVAVTVFWSYEGKTVDSNITAWAQPFIAALVDSPFLDLLNEYSTTSQGGNQTVTRGTSTPAYTITPTTATGATVTDADIVSELAAQVKAGKLPAVKNDANGNPNTVYILFFAPGITINGAGGTSCVDFCGYHSSGTSGSTTYTYAVIPDLTVVQTYSLPDGGSVTEPCGYGCAYQADTKPEVEWFNSTVSHEIAEAVTDPAISANNIAWYDQQNTDFACAGSESQNQPGGGEIGDVCVGFWDDEYGQGECEDTAKVPGTNIYVQQVWSNALDGCYAFNAATSPECPPGGCIDGGPGPVNPAGPTPDGGSGGSDSGAGGTDSGAGDAGSGTDATVPTGEDGGQGPGPNDSGSQSDATLSLGDDGGTLATTGPVEGGAGSGNGATGTSSSSGCSCTSAGGSAPASMGLGAALFGLAALARRRSRRRT
jgi:MYXO-CTERM domain-containing protein